MFTSIGYLLCLYREWGQGDVGLLGRWEVVTMGFFGYRRYNGMVRGVMSSGIPIMYYNRGVGRLAMGAISTDMRGRLPIIAHVSSYRVGIRINDITRPVARKRRVTFVCIRARRNNVHVSLPRRKGPRTMF